MTPLDPDRPLTGGHAPSWLDAPNLALPSLLLHPEGPGLWRVQFMFPSQYGRNAFSWVERTMSQGEELDQFLSDWWASPEDALRKYYYLEPPKGKIWVVAPRPEVDGDPQDASGMELDL